MNTAIFNEGIFNTPIFNTLVEEVEVDVGIGLDPIRPPNVDFVISASGWIPTREFRETLLDRKVVTMEKLREAKREKAELREMIELYYAA